MFHHFDQRVQRRLEREILNVELMLLSLKSVNFKINSSEDVQTSRLSESSFD